METSKFLLERGSIPNFAADVDDDGADQKTSAPGKEKLKFQICTTNDDDLQSDNNNYDFFLVADRITKRIATTEKTVKT